MSSKSNKLAHHMAELHCMIVPFEPEWKGYTTLALSQTTPPPGSVARVGATWSAV